MKSFLKKEEEEEEEEAHRLIQTSVLELEDFDRIFLDTLEVYLRRGSYTVNYGRITPSFVV